MTTTTLDAATVPATRTMSGPATVLRLESIALLVAGLALFRVTGGTWGWFFALLLVPDVAFVGWLVHARVGVVLYNLTHSLVGPALVGAAAWVLQDAVLAHIAGIWIAHIGMDRTFGYGLKYFGAFDDTHLGRV